MTCMLDMLAWTCRCWFKGHASQMYPSASRSFGPCHTILRHANICCAVLCITLYFVCPAPPCYVCTRGKAGKLQGNLAGCLAVLKGTPTTYNKDFQEVWVYSSTFRLCRLVL